MPTRLRITLALTACIACHSSLLSSTAVRRSSLLRRRRAPTSPLAQAGGGTIEDFLSGSPASRVLLALVGGCREVAAKIATASCDSTSCFNDLGTARQADDDDDDGDEEELVAIDLLAEQILFDALMSTGVVATASTEGDSVLRALTPLEPPPLEEHGGSASPPPPLFSVSLDPLDASSIVRARPIAARGRHAAMQQKRQRFLHSRFPPHCSQIDTNFAVGSIFAVWESPSLINVTGRQLVAAGTCTYGPRTAITLALADRPAVYEFLLVGDEWLGSNVYDNMGEVCCLPLAISPSLPTSVPTCLRQAGSLPLTVRPLLPGQAEGNHHHPPLHPHPSHSLSPTPTPSPIALTHHIHPHPRPRPLPHPHPRRASSLPRVT